MSHVTLLAADRPMPLREAEGQRHRAVRVPGHPDIQVTEEGFSVQEHRYYRTEVDILALEMKPCRYELDLRAAAEDLAALRRYLEQVCRPGDEVELWSLWVGADELPTRRFRGRLADLDLDTLQQLHGRVGEQQICLTVEL